jgi:amino acid transporter
MRWFKVAAIAACVLFAFLVISSIIGFLMEAAIAALVVATIVLAIKVAFYRKEVASHRRDREVREFTYSNSLPRHHTRDVDDELARLRREMDRLRREMGE